MQATVYSLHTPVPLAWLRALADAWSHRRSARATQRALAALDDRTLSDLGIDRSEILAIALNPTDVQRVRIVLP